MSQQNVERVRAIAPPDGSDLVELFGRSGSGSFSTGDFVGDDAPIRFVARSAETGGIGPRGFFDGWADWLEPWESYRIYNDEVLDRGDRVVLLVRLRGVAKRGGLELEEEAGAVFHFDGEKVTEIEFRLEPHEELRRV